MSFWYVLRASLVLIALWALLSGNTGVLVSCIIALALAFSALESVALALCSDLLWHAPETIHAWPWITMMALALLWASEPIRREILS
jgi:hypothetical protein